MAYRKETALSRDRGPRCPPASLGIICPVDARGLIVGPKIGFVQNKCVEFSLLSRGMVHLSNVALSNNKFSAEETGSQVIRGTDNSWSKISALYLLFTEWHPQ